jgi:hypothetical protein
MQQTKFTMRQSQTKRVMICLSLILFYPGHPADGAVRKQIEPRNRFQFEITNFRSELNLPLMVRNRTISIPEKVALQRLERYQKDERVEPIQLTVEGREDKIIELSAKIAAKNQKINLANYLKNNFVHGEEIPGTELRLVTLDRDAYRLLDRSAFDMLFQKNHQEVLISSRALNQSKVLRQALMNELLPFFDPKEISDVRKKIANNQNLSIDRDLLPKFARERVATHSIFRGPNCFHAALSFQGAELAESDRINVRQEPGYHRDMINYDELWRILQLSFYEINPEQTSIQYGDMIVFFETKTPQYGALDFKTLRHAATYLFGGYVFSKGSKSANSPYVVRTLAVEWETWTKYTEKLGVKVFRRNLKHVKTAPPMDPVDWVY